MKALGYQITDIKTDVAPKMPFNFKGIEIKEENLPHYIKQDNLSTGLFRTISLLIVLEHLVNIKRATLILIDDIGEGLDYERSSILATILKQYSTDSNIQLIATTNDSFSISRKIS